MSKQNPAAKAPSAPKQSVKPPTVAEPTAGIAELVPETLLAGIDQQGRSAQLTDPRLATLQRQTLAGKIGGQQGNGHLQQMISLARQNQHHAPYQPNTIHKNGSSSFSQRRQQSNDHEAEETVSDAELAALWGTTSEPVAESPEPPPLPGQTSLQRAGAPAATSAPADVQKVPTEEEKAAAKAKAAAAKARAAQTVSQGQNKTDKFNSGKEAEKNAGQAAKQKASATNGSAANAPGNTVGEIAVKSTVQPRNGDAATTPGGAGTPTVRDAQEKAPTSAAEDPAFQNVVANLHGVAGQEQSHPPATAKAKEAQAAAESPASEIAGKAQSNQVGNMAAAETPGFNGAAFKAKLMKRIEALTPKNAEDADQFKEQNKAGELKGDLQSETTAQKEQSQTPLATATQQAPDTGSVPPKPVTPLSPNTPGAEPSTPDASGAAPKAKSSAEVEAPMRQQSQQLDQQMAQANVTEEQLAKSNEPEFQAAATAKEQSQASSQSAPQAYRQDEQATINQAQGEATATAQAQMGAMHGQRAAVMEQVGGQQTQGKGKDEKARAEVGAKIQTIYNDTKGKVEGLLSSLGSEVNQLFEEGAESARQTFESFVDAEMEAYKEERYGGWLGWVQWVEDKLQPTQPEVLTIFQRGRTEYIKAMDAVIDNVVALIGRRLAEAKAEIANGKQRIQEYVSGLPAELQQVGQEAAQNIQSQFDELTQSIDAKQDQLIDTLANKYNEKLQAVDARIDQLKAENQTLYDMAADAVGGVIKTILQLKDMLLNVLARAAAAIEKIIADPIGFLGNLIDGVKLGLKNFMGNIGTHLQGGFISWLTGAIAGAGITLPENWDLAGIFQLVMQLLGLGFDKIMGKVSEVLGFDVMGMIEPIKQLIEIYQAEGFAGLAKMGLERLIGKEHMESLMHVWGIIQNVISGNWGALWGMLQEYLTNLKEMVFGKITEFITERVIKGGITWIISLFNPAGAFIKACKAIYDIVMFFVERGSQIMSLVNAVIDSVSAIAGGNINVAATAIEGALAKGIPVAIGFLSSLLGLGNVSEKVQEIIGSVRGLVENGINKVLNAKPVQMVAGFMKKVVGKIKGGIAKGVDWAKGKVKAGVETVKGTVSAGIGKLLGFFGIKITFAAGNGESHALYYVDSGTEPVLMMSSIPKPINEFLDFYINEYSVAPNSAKGTKIAEIRGYIKTNIDPTIKKLTQAKRSADKEKEQIIQKELLEKNVELSRQLRDLMSGDKNVGKIIDSYLLEGLAGTYNSIPKPYSDDMTADHQPQAAIFEWAAEQPYFGKTSNMAKRAQGRAAQGYAINLYVTRHIAGRTYGSKGDKTKNDFIAKARASVKAVNTNQEKRNHVVDIMKVELRDDVDEIIKNVVGKKDNADAIWADIQALPISKKEKNDLIAKIGQNISSGEAQIAQQPIDSLKE